MQFNFNKTDNMDNWDYPQPGAEKLVGFNLDQLFQKGSNVKHAASRRDKVLCCCVRIRVCTVCSVHMWSRGPELWLVSGGSGDRNLVLTSRFHHHLSSRDYCQPIFLLTSCHSWGKHDNLLEWETQSTKFWNSRDTLEYPVYDLGAAW